MKELLALTTFSMLIIILGTSASPVSRGRDDTSYRRNGIITAKVLSHLVRRMNGRSHTINRPIRRFRDERGRRSTGEAMWGSEYSKIRTLLSAKALLEAVSQGNHYVSKKTWLKFKTQFLAEIERRNQQT